MKKKHRNNKKPKQKKVSTQTHNLCQYMDNTRKAIATKANIQNQKSTHKQTPMQRPPPEPPPALQPRPKQELEEAIQKNKNQQEAPSPQLPTTWQLENDLPEPQPPPNEENQNAHKEMWERHKT